MKNYNVLMQEMSLQEMKEVNGGGKWSTFLKYGEKLVNAIGLADAAERFMDGWNEAGDSCEFV